MLISFRHVVWMLTLLGTAQAQPSPSALIILRAEAGQGKASAQFQLAMQYDLLGLPANSQYWLVKAARQGQGVAQYNLYQRYRTGKIVPQDAQKALFWLHKAACTGLVNAQTQLGLQLEKTQPEQAYLWFSQASKQGYPAALEGVVRLQDQFSGGQVEPDLCP